MQSIQEYLVSIGFKYDESSGYFYRDIERDGYGKREYIGAEVLPGKTIEYFQQRYNAMTVVNDECDLCTCGHKKVSHDNMINDTRNIVREGSCLRFGCDCEAFEGKTGN